MVKQFLKLIRWQNLIFLVYILFLLRYCILKPILQLYGVQMLLPDLQFVMLVIMTILMAAAGYMINDYFDYETDLINKKQEPPISYFNKNVIFNLHIILNIIGIALGFYLSFYISHPKIGILYILIAGILWFYSTTYKKQFLLGNVLIALLTAIVPFLVIIYELPLQAQLNGQYFIDNNMDFKPIIYWFSGFSLFAFITTLTREIVKDAEDTEGDKTIGARTMPVVWGIKPTKIILSFLYILIISAIWIIYFKFFNDYISLAYIIIFLTIPLVFIFYKTLKAKQSIDFHKISLFLKIFMFFGVSFAFVSCYNFLKILNQ